MPDNKDVRDALLRQEIERIQSKSNYHAHRISRGTADDEDIVAWRLYDQILTALQRMV